MRLRFTIPACLDFTCVHRLPVIFSAAVKVLRQYRSNREQMDEFVPLRCNVPAHLDSSAPSVYLDYAPGHISSLIAE
jgi:hypothetical protein